MKHLDYKNLKRSGKAMLVFQSHNIFYAKYISQSHIFIIQILSVLANKDNLSLFYYSKL